MAGSVAWITYAPVKGLRLQSVDEVELGLAGAPGDRRFHLVAENGRLINGKFASELFQVSAESDPAGTSLTLRFPDGSVLQREVELGDTVETGFYGRPVRGRLVNGAFAAALSDLAGMQLRLVRVDDPGAGVDRGAGAGVSCVSTAALEGLAREAGVDRVDGRRFRMLFGIDGVDAHVEDGWLGRRVAFGDAIVALRGLVGRCLVTSKSPDTGEKDLDTLRTIKRYRPDVDGEEPIPFGVFGSVERPGLVRVGDPVEPL
jgi:MOSC domain-containing protein